MVAFPLRVLRNLLSHHHPHHLHHSAASLWCLQIPSTSIMNILTCPYFHCSVRPAPHLSSTVTHARQWSLTPHRFEWRFGSPLFYATQGKVLDFIICRVKVMFIFVIFLNTLHHQPFCSSPILVSFQCNFGHFAHPYSLSYLLWLPLRLWSVLSLKFRIHTRLLLWLTEWFFSVRMFGRHLIVIKDFSDLLIGLLDNQQEVTLIDSHCHKNRKVGPLNKFPWRNIQ